MNPVEFLLFKMSFEWRFSEISGKRTHAKNIKVGGHKDSFHRHWLATDCEFDERPTPQVRRDQRKYCKRQGIQIIYKTDPLYFHLEPDI